MGLKQQHGNGDITDEAGLDEDELIGAGAPASRTASFLHQFGIETSRPAACPCEGAQFPSHLGDGVRRRRRVLLTGGGIRVRIIRRLRCESADQRHGRLISPVRSPPAG